MKLVQMLGIHSIMALVDDVIDVKIQHTVEKLLHQIQNQGKGSWCKDLTLFGRLISRFFSQEIQNTINLQKEMRL
jgi:hypothetical protein